MSYALRLSLNATRVVATCGLACLAQACGLLFSESDPVSNRTPRIGINYYKVTRHATGEILAIGCIAVAEIEEFPGFPTFSVPKGEAYSVLLSGGSKAGTIATEQERVAACASGPDAEEAVLHDRRCVHSVSATDLLLAADILDDAGAVVARSNSSTETMATIRDASQKFTVISQESGLVQFDLSNPPCESNLVFLKFPISVVAPN